MRVKRRKSGSQEACYDYVPFGQSFDVYAIALWDGAFSYLVEVSPSSPDFLPAVLFDLVESGLGEDWTFRGPGGLSCTTPHYEWSVDAL